jgi:hypothetical protein
MNLRAYFRARGAPPAVSYVTVVFPKEPMSGHKTSLVRSEKSVLDGRQSFPYRITEGLPLIQKDDTTRRSFVQFVQKRGIESNLRIQLG